MFGKKKKSTISPAQQFVPQSMQNIQRGMVSIPDVIAPPSVEVDFNHIRIGEKYYKTLFVVGYPRFVSENWLEPLIEFDHSMSVSMFMYPTSSVDVLSDLRRKIAEIHNAPFRSST